jgi:hypothetical protein
MSNIQPQNGGTAVVLVSSFCYPSTTTRTTSSTTSYPPQWIVHAAGVSTAREMVWGGAGGRDNSNVDGGLFENNIQQQQQQKQIADYYLVHRQAARAVPSTMLSFVTAAFILLGTSPLLVAHADEYGRETEAPTIGTGETVMICVKRGPLGACTKTEYRTDANENDKAKQYFKEPTELVKRKDSIARTAETTEGNALIERLKLQSDDNREKNDLLVKQRTMLNDAVSCCVSWPRILALSSILLFFRLLLRCAEARGIILNIVVAVVVVVLVALFNKLLTESHCTSFYCCCCCLNWKCQPYAHHTCASTYAHPFAFFFFFVTYLLLLLHHNIIIVCKFWSI